MSTITEMAMIVEEMERDATRKHGLPVGVTREQIKVGVTVAVAWDDLPDAYTIAVITQRESRRSDYKGTLTVWGLDLSQRRMVTFETDQIKYVIADPSKLESLLLCEAMTSTPLNRNQIETHKGN